MQAETKDHNQQIWDAGLAQLTILYRTRFTGDLNDYINTYPYGNKLIFNRKLTLEKDVREGILILHKFIYDR